jgi:hypothetical protein
VGSIVLTVAATPKLTPLMPRTNTRRAVHCEMTVLQCLLHRVLQLLDKLYSLSVLYVKRLNSEFVYATVGQAAQTQLRHNATRTEAVQVPKLLSVVSNNDQLLNLAAASR